MKKALLILIVFCSCSKQKDSADNSPGSISYKVNGNLVSMGNANVANGEGVVFVKQLKGSILPYTRYLLNAQNGVNSFLGFAIVTDSLMQTKYHYDSAAIRGGVLYFPFVLNYNAQDAYMFFNGDYFDITITSYKNSKISGTFSGKFSPVTLSSGYDYSSRGSILITDGKLTNIPVEY